MRRVALVLGVVALVSMVVAMTRRCLEASENERAAEVALGERTEPQTMAS